MLLKTSSQSDGISTRTNRFCSTAATALFLIVAALLCPVVGQKTSPLCLPQIVPDRVALSSLPFSADAVSEKNREFRACIAEGNRLTVFRDGTQIGQLDSTATMQFLKKHPALLDGAPQNASLGTKQSAAGANWAGRLWGNESLAGTLLDSSRSSGEKFRAVVDMGTWRRGLTISDEVEMAGSRVAVYRNSFRADALLQFYFVYAGAGYHGSLFTGALAETLYNDSATHYRHHALSWTVGLPFIRYEMKHAGWIVPEYVWLEDDITAVMDKQVEGRTISTAHRTWPSSHAGNVSHTIHLRAGHFYLDLLYDGDIYSGPLLRLSADELPTIFGTWGASLTKAADAWIPGVWAEFPELTRDFLKVGNVRLPISVEPLRIQFQYWNMRRYQFGVTTRVHLGYRILRGDDNG